MDFVEMLWAEHKKLRAELDMDPRWQRLEKLAELIATYEGKPKNDWPHSKWARELAQVKEFLGTTKEEWTKINEIAEWLDLNNGSNWSGDEKNLKNFTTILSASKMFDAFRGRGWRNKE